MDNTRNIQALQKSILFQNLSEEALASIATKVKFRQFFPEETIVWQGKPSDALFLIVNGIVTVKKIVGTGKPHILAYLMPGLTFGELGILENQPRSATVSALSDVDVLVISRKVFLEILHQYPSVAVELAKMLGRYLVETSRRQSLGNRDARLVIFFNFAGAVGATTLGGILAALLASKTQKSTVYVEYPNPQGVITDLQIKKNIGTFRHPAGFDILLSHHEEDIPVAARTALMLDQILNQYSNIVISVPPLLDETIRMILDYTKQIILICPPTKEAWQKAEKFQQDLKKLIRPSETTVFTVINRNKPDYASLYLDSEYDFDIPYFDDFPKLKELETQEDKIPEKVLEIIETCIDRLERTNQLSVFIPTTTDTNQTTDTSDYVQKTLAFLGERFGGATCKEAQGVWNSEHAGLVGEKVYIVHTYATQNDLNRYLDEVVVFIETLKKELRQEAMALEVNQKLTLI